MNTTTMKNALSARSALSAYALPQVLSAKLSAAKKCAYCVHRNECRSACGIMFGFCNADFQLDENRAAIAMAISRKFDRFCRSAVGLWDYEDAASASGGYAAMIRDNAVLLLDGDPGIAEFLEEYGDDDDPDCADEMRRAYKLLRLVRSFCTESRKYN